MYLKSLEIIGFKSFAAKTYLNFDRGVTVIVGPNGCGKSNVLDAIRWVLGEQSAKALRGGEMADVIFSGTDSRSALGMAEVSMTFAECEETLGVPWHEVTITRRVFRDGQGEYMLNRTPCRLRDIHQLFMDTGVGRSAYSIMEQGKIDQILSSRPEDRRIIFEEAAGITKFKAQRKEALKKLEGTEANLLRLADVIREVKRQIGSLQRQAAKAKRYKLLLRDMRVLETHFCKRQFDELDARRQNVTGGMEELTANQEAREQEVREREAAVAQHRAELEVMDEKLTEARQTVNELKNRVVQGESRIGFNNERIAEFTSLIERYEHDIVAANEKLESQQSEIETADQELEALQARLAEEEAALAARESSAGDIVSQRVEVEQRFQSYYSQIASLENRLSSIRSEIASAISARDGSHARLAILDEELAKLQNTHETLLTQKAETDRQVEQNAAMLAQRKEEVTEAETLLRTTQAELSELDKTLHVESRKLQEKESKLDILRQLNADGEGFSEGTQAVLKGLDNPDFFKPAVLGALAQFIEVAPAFIVPIEAALGHHLQAVVMKDIMVAEAVIQALNEKKMGRASLALRELWQGTTPEAAGSTLSLPVGCLGWAIDKVKPHPDVAPLVSRLLSGTIIVETLEQALKLAAEGGKEQYVTLNGELVTRDGIIQGGQSKDAGASMLQRKAQIAELETESQALSALILDLTQRRTDTAAQLESSQQRLQEARDDSQTLTLTLQHLRNQQVNLEREIADTARKLETFAGEREAIERRHDEAVARIECLEAEAAQITEQIAEHQATQAELQETLATLRESESAMNSELNELKIRVATERQRFHSLQNQRQPMQARMAELREMAEQRRRDIEAYTLKAAQLAEDSENVKAGIVQAQSRLGEAEEAVQMLLNERNAIVAKVDQTENLLRQSRMELNKCHEQRTQLEVRSSQVSIRLETLVEHVQRRYQLDIREFRANPRALLASIEEHRRRCKSNYVPSDDEAPEETVEEGGEPKEAEEPDINLDEIDWPFVESAIKDLEQRIDQMGPVNIDAIQEYDELEQRYRFLEQQNNDLEASKNELLEVIAKINTTTKQLFSETFERIRVNFQEMFKELFGGGKANLVLQDESDPLESGIEIIAKPPGKQLTSITLLSGGEKTMTAVALLFSIYMVKPSPFCVLDEMDAPLDESNINRFIKILDRFSQQSQFIVISHNKRTIARGDVIYGVTMEEHGVSKLVGVKFTSRTELQQAPPEKIPSVAESFGKHGDLASERPPEEQAGGKRKRKKKAETPA